MGKLAVATLAALGALAFADAASAAAQGEMRDKCREHAAREIRVPVDPVHVRYEGQRTDGTHAVNGSTDNRPPITFQCSFGPQGKNILDFVVNR